ncbi:unnamed protein product [Rhodiola kirilowii]
MSERLPSFSSSSHLFIRLASSYFWLLLVTCSATSDLELRIARRA